MTLTIIYYNDVVEVLLGASNRLALIPLTNYAMLIVDSITTTINSKMPDTELVKRTIAGNYFDAN